MFPVAPAEGPPSSEKNRQNLIPPNGISDLVVVKLKGRHFVGLNWPAYNMENKDTMDMG